MSIGCRCIQFLRSSFESRLFRSCLPRCIGENPDKSGPALGLSRFIGIYRGCIGAERDVSYDNATSNLGYLK